MYRLMLLSALALIAAPLTVILFSRWTQQSHEPFIMGPSRDSLENSDSRGWVSPWSLVCFVIPCVMHFTANTLR
jgi:hypothetical protein